MIDYPVIVKKVKQSIALIFVLDTHGDIVGTGSGFVFMKKGSLVTCNHVVAEAHNVLVNFFGSTQSLQGKVIVQDVEHDLALIKFNDDSREPLLMGKMGRVIEGMSILFSHCELGSEYLTTRPGILSSITKDANGITTYLIDGTVNSGNSGCPLMDASGGVIGVVRARRVVREDILERLRGMKTGPLSSHEIDLIKINRVLMGNLQLGVGYAIPASYIPRPGHAVLYY